MLKKEMRVMLESIMKLIAAQFGENCEVVLHDWSKEYSSTIVAIENGHVSGRKVGDAGSNLGLEVMRGTSDGSNQLNYLTKTKDGRILRSSSLYLKDEAGRLVGALCINVDVTNYINMQKQLSNITMFPGVSPSSEDLSDEFFTTDVKELLQYLIEEGTKQVGKDPKEMTREDKKKFVSYLDQKGAFLITKSGPEICQYLGISKYTLYSYLNEINGEQEKREEEKQ